MELLQNAAVLSLHVYQAQFRKREPVYVPPRSFHSLTLRLSGAISIRTESRELLSAAPCITYVPKGTGYHTEVLEDGQMLVVHFETTEEAQGAPVLVYTPENPARYQSLFSSLLKKHRPGTRRDYGSMALFYELLAELSVATDTGVPRRIQQARAHLDAHFADPQLSVDTLARELGISTVYLRREFKAAFGQAPHNYLQKLRLDNAKAMLQTGYYTVSQVAEQCGYYSLSYFSSAFHRAVGMSPSAYMQSADL